MAKSSTLVSANASRVRCGIGFAARSRYTTCSPHSANLSCSTIELEMARLALFSPLMLASICRMVTIASLVWICYRGTLNNHQRNPRKNALFCGGRTNLWRRNRKVTDEGSNEPGLPDHQHFSFAYRRQVDRAGRHHVGRREQAVQRAQARNTDRLATNADADATQPRA